MKTIQLFLCVHSMLTYVHCFSTSSQGIALIKHFEGFSLTAYQDTVGIWTIGWGHTKNVEKGDKWTQEKADTTLLEDLKQIEKYVNWYVKVPLNQNQFDALVSWTYNLGQRNLESSTMLKKLNKGKFGKVPSHMKKWVYAGGKKLTGLVKRRDAEARLFLGLKWQGRAISSQGISLIKRFEGCYLQAYQYSPGIWKIGWGHTKGVKQGDIWTQDKADTIFLKDIKKSERSVNSYVKVPLNQNQFDALVSWTYNLGLKNLKSSTMLKKLNRGIYDAVPIQIKTWVYSGDKKKVDLEQRRRAEADLFQRVDGKSISSNGIALIKHYAECRLTAYHDGVRTWVIGWGHTRGVKEGDKWTQEKADAVFQEDLLEFEEYVNGHVKVPLNQNQFDALVSWTFHLGPANLRSSTMLRKLNNGNYSEVPAEMRRWIYAGGKKLPGIIRRRNAEARLFQGLDWSDKSVSRQGLALIKHFADCQLTAYQDSAGIWTIGWGHTEGVKRGDRWTQAKADAVLLKDLKKYERYVSSYVRVPLTQNQFDALVSWTFHSGLEELKSSNMLKVLNTGDYSEIPTEMRLWRKNGENILSNSVERRNAEALLFDKFNWRFERKQIVPN